MNYGSLTATTVSGGYSYTYNDMNSQGIFAVGRSVNAPEPDWETSLRLAVKDQKVNLAQTFAEYRQVQNMFASNATTIAKALRQLTRGDTRGVFKTLGVKPKQLRGTISNRWLELQYGWKPLVNDLYGAVQELQTAFERPRIRKVTANAKTEARNVRTQVFYLDGRQLKAIDTDEVSIRVKAIVQMTSLSAQRLGFTNPAALAWELLPYSFVVDWFIPIGNWLNGLDALVGVEQCYGTVSRKSKYISISNIGGYYYVRSYGRTVFESLPGSNSMPRWKPSLGFGRVANALALLSQLKR